MIYVVNIRRQMTKSKVKKDPSRGWRIVSSVGIIAVHKAIARLKGIPYKGQAKHLKHVPFGLHAVARRADAL